jgi:hypothetical protein
MNPYVEVAVWLVFAGALLWLRQSVTESVRKGTEQALADYRHEHDRQLAEIDAANQRRGAEFNLLKRRQHDVYAKLYGRVKGANDLYARLIGLSFSPDFKRYTVEDVNDYLVSRNLKQPDGVAALSAIAAGDRNKAERLLADLHWRTNRRDAELAFVRAKNFEALHEVYFSDAVRAQMDKVRNAMAAVSVSVDRDDDERRDPKQLEKRNAMKAETERLLSLIRAELHRGEAGPGAAKAATTTPGTA